jgi:drug/metabolite transporter (DMT)-like permease
MFYAVAVIVAIFASIGHICFKKFALKGKTALPALLMDWHLISGSAFFGTGVILSIIALKYIDFSAYYSFTALNYLFISGLSKIYLKERIDQRKIIGNLIIISGILVYNL